MRSWLKMFRLQRGLTQQVVADLSNIKRSYYTMIESGNRRPSVSVAKDIAKVLGFEWTIFFESKCNEMKQNPANCGIREQFGYKLVKKGPNPF